MMRKSQRSIRFCGITAAALICVVGGLAGSKLDQKPGAPGTLKLLVLDETTKQPTPARVEVVDKNGKAYVAEDALPIIGGDCIDQEAPWQGTLEQALAQFTRKFANAHTGKDQFYTAGACRLSVPAGDYRVRAYKGLEYRGATEEIEIKPGASADMRLILKRWSNLPKQGWYSADSHLHVPRAFPELNKHFSKWMQGEDIHVANLLQWGNSKRFHNARQYAFGPAGLYHEGDYWLATGQENPRTHFLGHTLILGGKRDDAKKQTIAALEIAPTYERAQDLLLKLTEGRP